MSKLFKGLKKGLEEALAHSEGKITLKSEIIEIPEHRATTMRMISGESEKKATILKGFLQKY